MAEYVEKVTAFIVRERSGAAEVLLFEHPYAGVQFPAGTVNPGEKPKAAAWREAMEETGLIGLVVEDNLGHQMEPLPEGEMVVASDTVVYSRPDLHSFDWARLRRGIPVKALREQGGFVQVSYREHDREPDPQYVTMQITGWVPKDNLAMARKRHFYRLTLKGQTPPRWTVRSDNHIFTLFWAPVDALPKIIPPQDGWTTFLPG